MIPTPSNPSKATCRNTRPQCASTPWVSDLQSTAILSKILDSRLDLLLGSPLDSHLDHTHKTSQSVTATPKRPLTCFQQKSSHPPNNCGGRQNNLDLTARASNAPPPVLRTSLILEPETVGSTRRSCYPASPTPTKSPTLQIQHYIHATKQHLRMHPSPPQTTASRCYKITSPNMPTGLGVHLRGS